jgi:ergothioneine biosynthesis protein EgtB
VSASLSARFEVAWRRSDAIFGWLEEAALLERPIRLRQPFLFYLGHLPAFAWNHLGRGACRRDSFAPAFDELFARGIDPPDTGDGPDDAAAWPPADDVRAYRERVRRELRPLLDEPAFDATARLVLEHELMHHETLLYMLLRLDHALKRPPSDAATATATTVPRPARVRVPAGRATLGAARGSLPFGWDNEFPVCACDVPAFEIDATPVRNADFLEFVEAGGYGDARLWSEVARDWLQRRRHGHPLSWRRTDDGWLVRTLFADLPFEQARDWPACVTWAAAQAFARLHGRRLPSEAEYHRAAYGAPGGDERAQPWGDAAPAAEHGNFGLRRLTPVPVGTHARGASAWGVLDLVGNGWEWTSTTFAPFPGFEPLPTYPGYSADFFDGRHYVLKGASWVTDEALVRRSFRNWFQPHYPHVFTQFRLVSRRPK